ncbi:unnamed protein product [Amaranthus hypochondriacus]
MATIIMEASWTPIGCSLVATAVVVAIWTPGSYVHLLNNKLWQAMRFGNSTNAFAIHEQFIIIIIIIPSLSRSKKTMGREERWHAHTHKESAIKESPGSRTVF